MCPITLMEQVLCEIRHLCYKNWDCGCKRNAAIWLMSNNAHKHTDHYTPLIGRPKRVLLIISPHTK